jgi:beta-glucosidase
MRMLLGMYDAPRLPYSALGPGSVVDSAQARALALEAAQASLVLLENQLCSHDRCHAQDENRQQAGGKLLPLPASSSKGYTVGVVGRLANDSNAILGESNYVGKAPYVVTMLQGIQRRAANFSSRDGRQGGVVSVLVPTDDSDGAAVAVAAEADFLVVVTGHDMSVENEGKDRSDAEYELPLTDIALLREIAATRTRKKLSPLVLVLVNGMAIGTPWLVRTPGEASNDQSNEPTVEVGALVESFRGGQSAGDALASMLFGDFSPSGRMPYTVVGTAAELRPYAEMDFTKGRGYRYTHVNTSLPPPLYLFGDGLSFTTWQYSKLNFTKSTIHPCDGLSFEVTITNTGSFRAVEVAQVYITVPQAGTNNNGGTVRPRFSLVAVQRTGMIMPGASQTLAFALPARAYSVVYNDGKRYLEPGHQLTISVGGSSPAGLAAESIARAAVSVIVDGSASTSTSTAAPVPLTSCPRNHRLLFGHP